MSNAPKIAVPLLLLAAVAGGGAYYYTSQQHEPPPTVTPTPATTPKAPEPKVEPAPVVQLPVKTEPTRVVADTGMTHADAGQGVTGRVLLPNGEPAAGVPVYLLENMMNDMFAVVLNNAAGKSTPPLAAGQTAADGTFRLGVPRLGKAVDLRLTPEQYPEWSRQGIKVSEGDWYDTRDIKLEQGLVVIGRVIETHSKAPVANAAVYLASSGLNHTMVSAPGRERGMPTSTDANGNFRFDNAPRQGLVNLLAEAEGYSSGQLQNQPVKVDASNEFVLELELGQPIAGVVVDPDGKPLPSVTLNANGLSNKTPQTATTTTDGDGHFEFTNLRSGPYSLVATSPNHADTKTPLVMTGETEVKVVMASRGSVRLKVLAANDQAVKNYRLSLKKFFPQQPQNIGNVMEWADRTINPSDYPAQWNGEWALVRGLPSGDFRFQITDNAHAKTLSPSFTVVEGGEPTEVVCKLTLGGTITGTVIDDRGQPVADATVTTDMNGGFFMDSPLGDVFRSMMPEKHSKMVGKTNAQGVFRINKLAFADYMVRASHPDYCEGTVVDLKVEGEGQVLDAGVIQLMRGAIVEGVTMVGGQPAGQVKVTLSTPMTAEAVGGIPGKPGSTAPGAPPKQLFNATVQSEGTGQFRLLKRVPPGTYKATATRPTSGGSPFDILWDIKESEQQVVISPGQDRVTLTFQLQQR